MTNYRHRLPQKKCNELRTPLAVISELVDLNVKVMDHQLHNARAFREEYIRLMMPARPIRWADMADYIIDRSQRAVLFWDTIRKRGNHFIEHQAAGNPPVLKFDYEVVVDGASLPQPVNYQLARILPPAGMKINNAKRPFVIFDPRAGHGPGIGGFKPESQVGIALEKGHPVYFVIFGMHPVPGQTLADAERAQVQFLSWVLKEHPDSDKPCVMGNCQGGWAVTSLAAVHPELTGPLVLSGAPLSYWAGVTGKNPMRYLSGLMGGGWIAYLMSDLDNGEFDGANLVANFETLDPANTNWSKYYSLFTRIDTEAERFLDFERWWGGYMFMTSQEIHSILEDLFIGNKLSRGMIPLSGNMHIDLRRIQQPIIIFCSLGDNITPPQQALNWVADLYDDERAIKAAGQVIVYMIHGTTGHLGIFVSGAVVGREQQQIADTLEQIESLPPGLYEMKINDTGKFKARPEVRLEERTIKQLLEQGGETSKDEKEFELVKIISEFNSKGYDMFISPWVKAMSNAATAEMLRFFHPMRVQHWAFSDLNPWMAYALPLLARGVEDNRRPVKEDNPLLAMEKAQSNAIEHIYNVTRDLRDTCSETLFFAVYGMLVASGFSDNILKRVAPNDELARTRDEALVQNIAETAGEGDFTDAIMRILLLLIHARGHMTRSEIDKLHQTLDARQEFHSIDREIRRAKLHRQTGIVAYQQEIALATLPQLLPSAQDRKKAIHLLDETQDMGKGSDASARMWKRISRLLHSGDGRKLAKAS